MVVTNWSVFDFGAYEFDLAAVGAADTVLIRDLWQARELGLFSGSVRVDSIPAYGSLAFRLRLPQSFLE